MSPLQLKIISLLDNIISLIPGYMAIEEDRVRANGSVAVCIIDNDGGVHGHVYGVDKVLGRERYRVAWTKASQVWMTGIRTGEFEKRVFNNEISEKQFGLRRPDFIGWEGGQPVTLPDGTTLSVGVSGFRSVSDLEIVTKALRLLE